MKETVTIERNRDLNNPTKIVPKNDQFYLMIKRLLDIILASTGLFLLSPVFLVVAVAIKLEDPNGPIFFKQVRIGKDGKEFTMYKFRSMIINAEEKLNELLVLNEIKGAMFKVKDDPRITKIGKIIRKTSIDELPQFWNIIIGDMSLVGPRPPLPREVTEYTSYDKQRLLVTPGCTGLWQVSGRSSTTFGEMVELDLYYIKNRSLLFDFKIVCKTVIVLLKSEDAY